jgi:hypothetical protein
VSPPEPIDPVQRQLATRRLIAALRRRHRREPLTPDVRVDALIAEMRAASDRRPPSHRGAAPLTLDDATLRAVVDDLVAEGTLSRQGHRVRLADHAPTMDPIMRRRVDRLLAGLAEAGNAPPPVTGIAARLGIPPTTIEQLRIAGELVSIAPGIDYPRATWEQLQERLASMASRGPLTVSRVRNELRATRRHAEAILRRRREERRRTRRPNRSG